MYDMNTLIASCKKFLQFVGCYHVNYSFTLYFFPFYRWRLDLYLGWQNLRLLAVVGTKDFSKSLTLLHIIFAAVLM